MHKEQCHSSVLSLWQEASISFDFAPLVFGCAGMVVKESVLYSNIYVLYSNIRQAPGSLVRLPTLLISGFTVVSDVK